MSEVFGPTVQGEGPTAGRRAVFVRLGRCNLDCSWCDTPFTWDWDRFDPAVELESTTVELVVTQVVSLLADQPGIVVITGGEPLLQRAGLSRLLAMLADAGIEWIEIETNGTQVPLSSARERAHFNVSPKLNNSGVDPGRRYNPEALDVLNRQLHATFKFVVTCPEDLVEVQALVDAHQIAPERVWIMPEARTAALLEGKRASSLAEAAVARGWNVSSRLQVVLWGDERGR